MVTDFKGIKAVPKGKQFQFVIADSGELIRTSAARYTHAALHSALCNTKHPADHPGARVTFHKTRQAAERPSSFRNSDGSRDAVQKVVEIEYLAPGAKVRPKKRKTVKPKRLGNPNRPKKGDRITVEPIYELKDIQAVREIVQNNERNNCLFNLGINTNLRASDLLAIRVNQVAELEPGDDLVLIEKKTNKERRITLNKSAVASIQAYLSSVNLDPADFLFKSQRGPVLGVPAVSRMVKIWCKRAGLKGNFASHTLRKTWGYHQRVTFGVDIPTLMVCFNHTTQRQTLAYLCIQPKEIKCTYMNEL